MSRTSAGWPRRRRARSTRTCTSSRSRRGRCLAPGAIGNYELYGDRHLIVPNDDGLNFDYHLKAKSDGKAKLTIADAAGNTVRTIEGPANAGFNRVTWDMSAGRGRTAEPGEYKVTMEIGKVRAGAEGQGSAGGTLTAEPTNGSRLWALGFRPVPRDCAQSPQPRA